VGVRAIALFVRGHTLIELGRIREGEQDLREFLRLAPDHPKAPVARAMLGGR
jgi:hypothetical protein